MTDCKRCGEFTERVSALETALKQEETAADRTIWNLTQENIRLRSLLDGFRYNGCFTGDCPHDTVAACMEDLSQYAKEVDEGLQSRQDPSHE